MTAKDKAEQILHKYRMMLMNEGEDYGEEILVSLLSTKCALIAVDQIILANPHSNPFNTEVVSTMDYWLDVKKHIQNL